MNQPKITKLCHRKKSVVADNWGHEQGNGEIGFSQKAERSVFVMMGSIVIAKNKPYLPTPTMVFEMFLQDFKPIETHM